MIKIFAKYGTDNKVACRCKNRSDVAKMQLELNDKMGGNWLLVDQLEDSEILSFQDSDIYKGFDSRKTRYSKAILSLK